MRYSKYSKLPGINATKLKRIIESPKALRHYLDTPFHETPSMRVGTAGHTAILEPERFLGDYVFFDGDKRRKEWKEFKAAHEGDRIIDRAEYDTALAMRKAVLDHPVAGDIMRMRGEAERAIQWTHARTGEQCKALIDWHVPGAMLVDVKTARSIEPTRFGNDSASLNYHVQFAWYSDGAFAAGLGDIPFKVITVANKAPHDVVVFDVPDDVLQVGRDLYEDALDLYLECKAADCWPGGYPEEQTLRLPYWAQPQDDEPLNLTFDGESLAV